jgi:hypothetical protein
MTLRALRVREPCHEDWEAMVGDERARLCASCDKRVTNLSELTRAEAEAALSTPAPDGSLCVRFTRDAGGDVITRTTHQERLVGLLHRLGAHRAAEGAR